MTRGAGSCTVSHMRLPLPEIQRASLAAAVRTHGPAVVAASAGCSTATVYRAIAGARVTDAVRQVLAPVSVAA